jgi:hypothetical protein
MLIERRKFDMAQKYDKEFKLNDVELYLANAKSIVSKT